MVVDKACVGHFARKVDCSAEDNITVSIAGEELDRNCCGEFRAKEIVTLASNSEYSERVMRTGICPQCNSLVVEVDKRRYTGEWVHECCKRQKAKKLYDKYKSDIIGEFDRKVPYGTKTNMAFKYGLNIEKKDRKGNTIIEQYAVDFNETKELRKVIRG